MAAAYLGSKRRLYSQPGWRQWRLLCSVLGILWCLGCAQSLAILPSLRLHFLSPAGLLRILCPEVILVHGCLCFSVGNAEEWHCLLLHLGDLTLFLPLLNYLSLNTDKNSITTLSAVSQRLIMLIDECLELISQTIPDTKVVIFTPAIMQLTFLYDSKM